MDPARTQVVETRVRLTVSQLSRRVHLRLGQLDMTTTELSKKMRVTRGRVSLLINSERITVRQLKRLSRALQVNEAWWRQPIGLVWDETPDSAQAMLARVKKICRTGKEVELSDDSP